MKKFTEEEIKFIEENRSILSFKEIAATLNRDYKTVVNFSRKKFGKTVERGKSQFSRKKRQYKCNDLFFSKIDLISCYWAGFIAADGCLKIKHNELTVLLARVDRGHLVKLAEAIEYNGPIGDYIHKYSYKGKIFPKESSVLRLTSESIKKDLINNFNITPKKSLTLKPPYNLLVPEDIDAFIIGYLDGDGSIFLTKGKRQKSLSIQILGTKQVLEWIQIRISKILNEELNCIYKKNKKSNRNTFSFVISDRRARRVFQYFDKVGVAKLERKWSTEIRDYCANYKKFKNRAKYETVYQLLKEHNQLEVAKILGLTQAAVSWYTKQPIYSEVSQFYKTK